ncbi:MAG: nicotinamide riboside transporter PnuC [Paludibacteraceae bacterium]
MNYLELFAVILGILSVWYARKENILVFPFGIASVAIFVYIFFINKLYANAVINGVYLITNSYGWYNWARPQADNEKLKITKYTKRQNLWLMPAVALVYIGVLLLLRMVNKDDLSYASSSLPWIDSANATIFFFATILMTFKKLENWLFWIVGNIISIPIFLSQELYFTGFQYAVFLVLAVSGYIEWKKKIEKNT